VDKGGGEEQGVGALIGALMTCSSKAWTILRDGQSLIYWARVIALLKEAYRPFPKKEISGSLTAI
jgi:hypothetical protein